MKKIRFPQKIDIISFVLASIFFIVVGVFGYAFSDNFINAAEMTEARICDIDEYTERNRKGIYVTKHKVYVDYTVDGEPYDHVLLDNYNPSMKVGSVIEIYYNAQNPGQISKGDKTIYIFFLCGGVILAGIAIYKIFSSGREKQIN